MHKSKSLTQNKAFDKICTTLTVDPDSGWQKCCKGLACKQFNRRDGIKIKIECKVRRKTKKWEYS